MSNIPEMPGFDVGSSFVIADSGAPVEVSVVYRRAGVIIVMSLSRRSIELRREPVFNCRFRIYYYGFGVALQFNAQIDCPSHSRCTDSKHAREAQSSPPTFPWQACMPFKRQVWFMP